MQEPAAVHSRDATDQSVTPASRDRHDTVVVGAGISGLTVAWHLQRAGVDVTLLDARPQAGGCIETEQRDGFLLEKGPFNVMVRDPAFEEILDALSDRLKVISASDEAKKRYIYRRGRLHAVPAGPVAFLRSPLLSLPGRLRALRGLVISRRGRAAETTIEEFATRRFGREVADTVISAAVAGILSGDIRRLNAYACFPMLRDFDQKSISPLGRTVRRIPAMIRKKRDPKSRRKWKGLVSIDRGLGGLCHEMAAELGDRFRTEMKVEKLSRFEGEYVITLAGDTSPKELRCRDLVLATPAREAGRLLEPMAREAARLICSIDSASLTVVNLAFRRDEVAHPLDGFGFLVPHNEPEFPLMGALFADSAFPHHAPREFRLLRVFIGGSRTPDVNARSPEELVETARRTLRDVLGVTGEPELVDVCPYPDAIPQYYLDHTDTVARVRGLLAPLSGLHLAGNYLDGVSINDCIKLGKQVAADVSSRSMTPDSRTRKA